MKSMILLLLMACKAATPEVPVSIDAHALTVKLDAVGGTEVRMTVHNPSDAAQRFCRYHTPFEGIRNRIFRVVGSDGEEISYEGMMAKRAPPGPEDFLLVAPGKDLQATVDLERGYAMKSGSYSVNYRGTSISGLPDSNVVTVVVK